ncbi:MAG: hypothetical protein H6742_16875 [Alphaproteobacteria bacterium]|nr:hypothetical protein [Alphaproteobacteria bacterium]
MLCLLILAFACTDKAPDDGATDSGSASDGGASDGGDTTADAACLDAWVDGTWDLVPDGPATQIHTSTAWDGSQQWYAWAVPDALGSHFDIWLAAVDCAGDVTVAPVEVTQSDDNELDPALAAGVDGVLVAWTSDRGAGADNLDIRLRAFDPDGAPRTDAADLVAERSGVVVTGNATLPQVATTSSGFHLAGSWGHADATAFQAFALELDADGAAVGAATDLGEGDNAGQLYVAIAGAGAAHAWTETHTTTLQDEVRLREGSSVTTLGEGTRPSAATTPAGTWVAWDDDAGAVLLRGPDGVVTTPDLDGGFRHSARLAAHGDALALSWMAVESGVYNTLYLAWLGPDGSVQATEALASDVVGVYGSELVLVDADHALAAWTEGSNPDFRARSARRTRP